MCENNCGSAADHFGNAITWKVSSYYGLIEFSVNGKDVATWSYADDPAQSFIRFMGLWNEAQAFATVEKAEDLNDLANKHAKWLKSMGWWKNKTPLESLMLVVSECGEAANEVRGEKPTEHFADELADIILRTLGIASEQNIDIQQAVWNKMANNRNLKPNPDRLK